MKDSWITMRKLSVLLIALAGLIAMCGQDGWGWFLILGLGMFFCSFPFEIEFQQEEKKDDDKTR